MNIKYLAKLSEKIDEINDKEEKALKEEISKHRYSSILYTLLCKIYFNKKNPLYDKSLTFASLYSPNRFQLKKYLQLKKHNNLVVKSHEEKEFLGEDLSLDSKNIKIETPTETLAKIFEEKKDYEQAIRIYRTLLLKFPERKLYFENIIQKLRDKINNYS